MARGRRSSEARLEVLRAALRVLDDPIALEETPLATTPAFVRRAEQDFRRRTCAVGLAVAAGLTASLNEIGADLAGTPVGELAAKLADGRPQVEVAAALGITTQHLTRRYKPVLLRLLDQKLRALE